MTTVGRRYVYWTLIVLVLVACSRKGYKEVDGMIYIPAGEFIMGSEDVDTEGLAKEFGARKGQYYEDERPVRKVYLDGFFIDKYEVTNKEYKAFVTATGYTPPGTWENNTYEEGKDDHPVNNVTWYGAYAYCKWAGKRLPTEKEWEKAARGPNGNRYPWGNEFDEGKANLTKGSTAPAGSSETDKSYYGVFDMGGNVMEWVDDWYKPYPGNQSDNKEFGEKYKILRGGSGSVLGHYVIGKIFSRASFRHYYDPRGAGNDGGFRCARSVKDE